MASNLIAMDGLQSNETEISPRTFLKLGNHPPSASDAALTHVSLCHAGSTAGQHVCTEHVPTYVQE